MARSAQPVKAIPGHLAATLVATMILGTLVAVALRADSIHGLTTADWSALRFTIKQAVLSSVLSVALAIPVARALARRRFWGRRVMILIMGAPFILPVIVAIFGLLQVFGRSGWVSDILGLFGLPPVQIYGLHGVVLAHMFFNLPLATRLILQGWQEIPAERFRLAAQLGCSGRALFRLIELPMLSRIVPAVLAVIFSICLTSFAVALTLGGGPGATTIELAIYRAFTYDFDLGRAALLSSVQLALTGMAAFLALRLSRTNSLGSGLDRVLRRWDTGGPLIDGFWIFLAGTFLIMPLASVVLSGLVGLLSLPLSVLKAAATSLGVATVSTVLLMALALPMAVTVASGRRSFVEISGVLGIAASPLVIGTGLFVLTQSWVNPVKMALPVTALVNAIMALPFALRILVPAACDTVDLYGRLALSLDMRRRTFFTRILIPRMLPQIGFAAGLSAALSMGDLGVIMLFSDPRIVTLPLEIYHLMGAYQMGTAASGSLLLLILSMGLFWILDRGGRRHAEA